MTKQSGIFGKLFDLDIDGKLNAMERALDYMLFDEMTRADKEDGNFLGVLNNKKRIN